MSERVENILRGAGLTDEPDVFDSNIHSWRCEHPDRYGKCDCFQLLVKELAEVERAAAEKAWDEGFDAGERDAMQHQTFNEPCIENPYRAALGLTAGQEGENDE